MVKNCTNGQSRAAPTVPSAIAANTLRRVDRLSGYFKLHVLHRWFANCTHCGLPALVFFSACGSGCRSDRWSKGMLADHRQPRRNRGRKVAKNEGDVFSLLKRAKFLFHKPV